MLDWIATHQVMLIGTVWMIVLGPAMGNYACSVIYRLPRGQTPFERHPFCGHCNTDLKPIDLFPILSWLSTRGHCRYCDGAIPGLYTVVEFACGGIFVAYFLHFGISELFLLYAIYGIFVVILAAIHHQQQWISVSIYSYALALILLARTLAEGTIYGPIRGAVVMLVIMLALMRAGGQKTSPFTKPWVWWFVLFGALVPMVHWALILPVYILKLLVPKPGRVVIYTTAALALPLFVT